MNKTALISIRLNNTLLQEVKRRAHTLHLTQTEYIRRAINHMNQETEKFERKKRLKRASLLVREQSMDINTEFGGIEYDPET